MGRGEGGSLFSFLDSNHTKERDFFIEPARDLMNEFGVEHDEPPASGQHLRDGGPCCGGAVERVEAQARVLRQKRCAELAS